MVPGPPDGAGDPPGHPGSEAVAVIDVIMPARDEATTVADNVRVAAAATGVRRVIVVDDGSVDGTGAVAEGAGAVVVRRDAGSGSKAHAMAVGVEATDATHLLFVDADCTGLRSSDLEAICAPVLEGRAEMSLGFFDYGWLNWLVLRLPPLTGERIVPRWVWEQVTPDHLDGYTIEIRLNEVVSRGGHRTAVRTMLGVGHRTKRHKFGIVDGFRRTFGMYRDLVSLLWPIGDVPWRTYLWYLRGLSVEEPSGVADE